MWLLPSRARPENLRRFFEAYAKTGGSTPGMVLVDRHDWEDHVADYMKVGLPLGWIFHTTIYPTQGAKIREVWPEVKDCGWLGLIGDDNIPETQGWDQLMLERLGEWSIVSCNDAHQAPRRLANCWIMSGPLVRAVGYIFPPGMEHLFVDDVWETIGRDTGCWDCRMDVTVRHANVLHGEAPIDETHRAAYGDGFKPGNQKPDRTHGLWASDEAAFNAWRADDYKRIITTVQLQGGAARVESIAARMASASPEHKARMERARSRKVMLVTPILEKPAWQYLVSALETVGMLTRLGIANKQHFVVGNSNLPKARNELAAIFLASGCTDAMLTDADMGWKANDIIRLLSSDKPLIGGVGRKKVDKPIHDPAIWCVRLLPGSHKNLRQDEMGAVQVAAFGTAFMRIERGVFEKLIAAHPKWKLKGRDDMEPAVRDSYYRLFRFPHDKYDTGEDYHFCNEWRSLGGEVWVDPTINLIHSGNYAYSGCFGDVLQAAPEKLPMAQAAE